MSTELLAAAESRNFGVIVRPAAQDLINKIADDLDDAKALVIDSETMAQTAVEIAGRVATVISELDGQRLVATKPLRDGVEWLNGGFNPIIAHLKNEQSALKAKIVTWNEAVAAERRKREQEAEAQRRREAEAAEAQRREAEAAAQKLIDEAKAANAAGDIDKAGELAAQAQITADQARERQAAAEAALFTRPVIAGGASRVKGGTERWKAELDEQTQHNGLSGKAALIIHVAQRLQAGDMTLVDALDVNWPALNAIARVAKQNLNIPGVRAVRDVGLSVRKGAV